MKHLHHDHPTLMVHCDLKHNNVQIDDNMVIHLGDFGIVKLLSENVSRKQTTTLVTIGYMIPSDFSLYDASYFIWFFMFFEILNTFINLNN